MPVLLRPVAILLGLVLMTSAAPALTTFTQASLPAELQENQGALLEENDVFFTVMTESTVRTIAKGDQWGQLGKVDPEGDREFISHYCDGNGDYWYWAHQKARQALALALQRHGQEAARIIRLVPETKAVVPEYQWILTPEFALYLDTCETDLAYQFDPVIGVEVFLTNYQVERVLAANQGKEERLNWGGDDGFYRIDISELLATPRDLPQRQRSRGTGRFTQSGDEQDVEFVTESVGLDAILNLPQGGIHEALVPTSDEFKNRPKPVQERLLTASDYQLKIIPISCSRAKDLLEPLMSDAVTGRLLAIEGSTTVSGDTIRLIGPPRIVVRQDLDPQQNFRLWELGARAEAYGRN